MTEGYSFNYFVRQILKLEVNQKHYNESNNVKLEKSENKPLKLYNLLLLPREFYAKLASVNFY